ncbi:alcohol dehydrogenase catalytic domain-containing protein [Saccharopolyspora sp. K220]|uniref:zinc-binding dehydrogenase n=1 Tax=Saccharopolyspora soli TaxID=2926618 RepID=UPI001F59D2D5|nr:alcohol dehydrogenase catalytic domain-containing protein [Saccharopolyspora soli]MCI2420036.1 alcohol dehydrogenase catalytic domain-containing protein [Saccharopolyspora soli]
MRIRAAVLRQSPISGPYATTTPLSIEDLWLDDPGPGEVLVRVDAAGLCHSDLSVVDGNRPRPLPMALGHEAAGTVLEVGVGVYDVRPGDRVVLVYVPSCGVCRYCGSGRPALCPAAATANGCGALIRGGSRLRDATGADVRHHLGVSGFATHSVVDRNSLVVIGADVPADVAALFGCAMLTGFGAVVHTAAVRPGDSVAVFGLGGVGQAAVMAAVAAGAYPVVAVDPVGDKQKLALDLGASHVGPPDVAASLVKEASPGGVDWAFEVVGSAAVLESAYAVTGRGGTAVAVGLPHPDTRVSLPVLDIVAGNRGILGSYMGSAQPQLDIPAMIALWRAGRLPVDRLKSTELPLSDINSALDALAGGAAVRQIVVPT